MLCPQGIVLAADMRETTIYPTWQNRLPLVKDNIKKIYPFKQGNIGISCWGLAEITTETNKKDIVSYLEEFDNSKVKEGFTLDDVAEELKITLESISPKIEHPMGFHIAAYLKNRPKLRHVFHMDWHNPGEFTNEDCHLEYHTEYGDKLIYRIRKEYPPLFNGDSFIANAFFNYATQIQPYYYLLPHKLSLDECVSLARMIIDTAIQRLDYYVDSRKFEKINSSTVGGGISIAKITETKGFEWIN